MWADVPSLSPAIPYLHWSFWGIGGIASHVFLLSAYGSWPDQALLYIKRILHLALCNTTRFCAVFCCMSVCLAKSWHYFPAQPDSTLILTFSSSFSFQLKSMALFCLHCLTLHPIVAFIPSVLSSSSACLYSVLFAGAGLGRLFPYLPVLVKQSQYGI